MEDVYMYFSKKYASFISLVLVVVMLVATTNNVCGQEVITHKNYITADELNFQENEDNSSFTLKTNHMKEDNTLYNWSIKNNNTISLVIKGIIDNEETYSKDFTITFSELQQYNPNIDLKQITNNDIIEYIKYLYNENYTNCVQQARSIEKNTMNTMSATDVLVPVFTASEFAGAFGAALLSFLAANWAIIVIVLVIAAVIVSAALLFDYLHQKCAHSYSLVKTPSLHKHIAIEDIRAIRRPENKFAAYYSPSQNVMLVVYNISKGYRGNVNSDMNTDSKITQSYDMNNFDLTGFKLLVLYDFGDDEKDPTKVFHAEVRYGIWATRAIERFRYTNKMIKQIWPVQSIDQKYAGPIPLQYQRRLPWEQLLKK